MGEFSAHRVTVGPGEKLVIATKVDLYVSTLGDDVLNSGIEQDSPFRTPARAIQWLSDKLISESGFVSINFAAGIYDIDEQLIMDHPQGQRVAFIGASPELLILQNVNYYKSQGLTATGYVEYYSGIKHGITMSCVRPSNSTIFAPITSANAILESHKVAGSGVIIEDYGLVYDDDYSPTYFYASYPAKERNNILRQGAILGCHSLLGVTSGIVSVESSIRDDWFLTPLATTNVAKGRFFGNAQTGITYGNQTTVVPGSSADLDILAASNATTNGWLDTATDASGLRKHYISSVPVGYYGKTTTSGIITGATANFIGATFPTAATAGSTATFTFVNDGSASVFGFYSFTGPAGSMLNDSVRFGNNYHAYDQTPGVTGYLGNGGSGSWGSINTNQISVKILPTVFRRYGTIMSIKSGGLRKIKNIFFDGKDMPCFYGLIGNGRFSTSGVSNKMAIYTNGSRSGESVINEPTGLGSGLCDDVGIKDFHVGLYIDRASNANIGKVIISNCAYGILLNNGSAGRTIGSVCTGSVYGFAALNSSSLVANRCYAAHTGQSLIEMRMTAPGATQDFTNDSFNVGQTYASPDGKIKGTVYDWDSREKSLTIAVRTGVLEGKPTII